MGGAGDHRLGVELVARVRSRRGAARSVRRLTVPRHTSVSGLDFYEFKRLTGIPTPVTATKSSLAPNATSFGAQTSHAAAFVLGEAF